MAKEKLTIEDIKSRGFKTSETKFVGLLLTKEDGTSEFVKNENEELNLPEWAKDFSVTRTSHPSEPITDLHTCKYCGCKTTQPDEYCWNAPKPNNNINSHKVECLEQAKEAIRLDDLKRHSIDSTSKIRFTFAERLQILFGYVLVVKIKTTVDKTVTVESSEAHAFVVKDKQL